MKLVESLTFQNVNDLLYCSYQSYTLVLLAGKSARKVH